ncbi:B3 DNA binding domain containing protein [Parasponia andersonii]|uniref:B3 DNA binding domain containing protein n=1 Tax=Parasponia andersonii TaxID=3476 RepID=A0A2P5BZ19_PARAD|nr:B3 DNA binding domain containing protein [Parasponia andersonii]
MSRGAFGDSNQRAFSSGNPHFFKIVLEETLQENKLLIPNLFPRKCRETLSNSVTIKLPCGSNWKMKLKNDGGKVWLDKGWPEFAKHYSIKRGHLLIFRYEGNSEFHAVIFDTSTVEIDYPSIPVHSDEPNIDGELRVPKREVIEDDSVQVLDDCPPSRKTRETPLLPCSQPHKKMRTSPTAKTQCNSSCPKQKSEMKGKHNLHCNKSRKGITKTLRCMKASASKPLGGSDEVSALQKASDFKTKRPFFKVVIKPCSAHGKCLNFPASFARKYLKDKPGTAILKVSNESRRTWSVKFKEYHGTAIARFQGGWPAFARGNNLEVGDVCVFVLLNDMKLSFEVVIFHLSGRSATPVSPGRHNLHARPDRNQSTNTRKRKFEILRRMKPSTSKPSSGSEEVAALQKASDFKSKRPFFKVVMKSCYVRGSHCYLSFPASFARKYLRHKPSNVILKVSNGSGRTWSVKYRFKLYNGTTTARFKGGWMAFSRGNSLEVGDVCVFVLLKDIKLVFEVVIFRVSANSTNPMSPDRMDEAIQVEPEEKTPNETESSGTINDEPGTPSSLDNLLAKQANRGMSTIGKRSSKLSATRRQRCFTLIEKARLLERARFESKKPFFKIVIQPSFVHSRWYLELPLDFAKRYLKNKGDVVLSTPNGRTWFAQFRLRHLKSRGLRAEFCCGWMKFVEDSNLKVGDVCIFELINGCKIGFKVRIVRAADEACHQKTQGDWCKQAKGRYES